MRQQDLFQESPLEREYSFVVNVKNPQTQIRRILEFKVRGRKITLKRQIATH